MWKKTSRIWQGKRQDKSMKCAFKNFKGTEWNILCYSTVYIWKVWALWQMLVNVAMTNIWSLQCCFFYGGKKTGEKPSEQGKNQQKTQPSCDARSRIQTRVTLVEGERSNHCTILVPHISIHPLGFLLWNKNILQMILVLHFSYSHYTRVRWDLCHI